LISNLTDIFFEILPVSQRGQIRGVFYLFVASQIPTDVDKTSLDHGKTSVGYGSTLV